MIFADRINTSGGSPGDSTSMMLQAFIEAGLEDTCIPYIVDPEAVVQCQIAGVGAKLPLEAGAKSTPLQEQSDHMLAEVIALSNGHFRYDGPMFSGFGRPHRAFHLCQQDGIYVLLVTQREQPFDTAFYKHLDWLHIRCATSGSNPRPIFTLGLHLGPAPSAWYRNPACTRSKI